MIEELFKKRDYYPRQRVILFMRVGFLLFIGFIGTNLVSGMYEHAVAEALFLAAGVLIMLFFYRKHDYLWTIRMYLALLFLFFSYHILFEAHFKSLFWALSFPLFAFLLTRKREALAWSFLQAGTMGVITLLCYFGVIELAYPVSDLLEAGAVYLFYCTLIFLFDREANENQYALSHLNATLKAKIKEEIEKSKQKDAILFQQNKQAQMGEMVSMIAHQWRQPLNAISASAIKINMMIELEAFDPRTVYESNRYIQNQAEKMSEIINTFIDYTKPKREKQRFLATDAILQVINIIGKQFDNHDIRLELINVDQSIPIYGNINLFEQVLMNLFINARDAFDGVKTQNCHIVIEFNDDNRIVIEDNAGGIEKSIREKIFNPYFTTKTEHGGTGLGLYMSQQIMQKEFQGDLIFSPVEEGSRFMMLFPESGISL